MKNNKELDFEFTLDPSSCEILGVFGKDIYIRIESFDPNQTIVLLIGEDVFHGMWRKWVQGKREYCERFNHFCGVMGYFIPEDCEVLEDTITVHDWNELESDYNYREVSAVRVRNWSEEPDFEHG